MTKEATREGGALVLKACEVAARKDILQHHCAAQSAQTDTQEERVFSLNVDDFSNRTRVFIESQNHLG